MTAAAYPKIKVRMLFGRGRVLLYEDYLALEHMHFYGTYTEDSRAYYDEIRWVVRYRKRDWPRLFHAILLLFPVIGFGLLALLVEEMAVRIGALVFFLPCAALFAWSLVRLIASPRTMAVIQSPRGSIEFGIDWPRSSNPEKDAGVFFERFLSRVEMAPEAPPPPPVAVSSGVPAPDAPAPSDGGSPPPSELPGPDATS